MYNLRSRGRLASAGSARPQVRMGVRAPPAVASQVTPSQALAVLDSENMTKADLFNEDDDISVGSNLLVSDDSLSEEALQPPCLPSVVPVSTTSTSAEQPQNPRSSIADPQI